MKRDRGCGLGPGIYSAALKLKNILPLSLLFLYTFFFGWDSHQFSTFFPFHTTFTPLSFLYILKINESHHFHPLFFPFPLFYSYLLTSVPNPFDKKWRDGGSIYTRAEEGVGWVTGSKSCR